MVKDKNQQLNNTKGQRANVFNIKWTYESRRIRAHEINGDKEVISQGICK